MKQINKQYQQVRKEAVNEVIKEARKIMTNRPHLVEFILAMGTYFFVDKEGETVDTHESYMTGNYEYRMRDSRAYFKRLNNFMSEWDEVLKLSGEGIRFKVSGKIVTDW